MKKLLTYIIGITMFASSAIIATAETNGLDLVFAEECRNRESCTEFPAQGDKMIRQTDTKQGDSILIDIIVKNPDGLGINSVASWVKYDPSALKALDIEADDSLFDLASPDGDKVNAKEGLVQIGRAAIGGAITDDNILVASISFEVIASQPTSTDLEFFNFQETELGQTGVFSTSGLLTENVLTEKPKKLSISLNGFIPGGVNNVTDNTTVINNRIIARPTGLRIRSENEGAKFIWDIGTDPKIDGYFVYYSTQSGTYIFRKDAAESNSVTVDGLKTGQRYYFAVVAYDAQMNESDYSDEVFADIGIPNSESHPFMTASNTGNSGNITNTQPLVEPGGTTDDVGPSGIIYYALSIALLIAAVFRLRLFRFLSFAK